MSVQGTSDDSHDLDPCVEFQLEVVAKSYPRLFSQKLFATSQYRIQKHRQVAGNQSFFG